MYIYIYTHMRVMYISPFGVVRCIVRDDQPVFFFFFFFVRRCGSVTRGEGGREKYADARRYEGERILTSGTRGPALVLCVCACVYAGGYVNNVV